MLDEAKEFRNIIFFNVKKVIYIYQLLAQKVQFKIRLKHNCHQINLSTYSLHEVESTSHLS